MSPETAAFQKAARRYTELRESGHPTTGAYRAMRKAWSAMVKAESKVRVYSVMEEAA